MMFSWVTKSDEGLEKCLGVTGNPISQELSESGPKASPRAPLLDISVTFPPRLRLQIRFDATETKSEQGQLSTSKK
jgi:hypothetical protein